MKKVIILKSGKILIPRNCRRYIIFDREGNIHFSGSDTNDYQKEEGELYLHDKFYNETYIVS